MEPLTRPVVAVLDASALFGKANRRALIQAARLGIIVGYWTPYIVEEMARSLTTYVWTTTAMTGAAKRDLSAQAKVMMHIMVNALQSIDPRPPFPPQWPGADPGDAHLLAAARMTAASYIVSENTRHFPPAVDAAGQRWQEITYITTTQFLDEITD